MAIYKYIAVHFVFLTLEPFISVWGFLIEMTYNKTRKLALSGVIIALYVVIMFVAKDFSFGLYQVRIATCLYSLSYFFPFLIVPMGVANFLSNVIGGMGPIDMFGGALVGIIASAGVYAVRRFNLPKFLVIPIIILVPGLIVSTWLSVFLNVPYVVMVINLCIGQTLPAIAGYMLVLTLPKTGVLKLWM